MESSALQQENLSLKEQLETEMSSVNSKKHFYDENENLILLKQKGIKIFNYFKTKMFY